MHGEKDVSPVGTNFKRKRVTGGECSCEDLDAVFSSEANIDLDPDPAPDPAFCGQTMTPL